MVLCFPDLARARYGMLNFAEAKSADLFWFALLIPQSES